MRRIRYYIFLKDVLLLSCTAFGGPQVHLMMMLDRLVHKRNYLTEEELLELNALGQVLPGPTSTQTITALGYRIGGAKLAYLTLLVWSLPAMVLMMAAAVGTSYIEQNEISLSFTRFVGPMAVGFLLYGGLAIAQKVVHTYQGWGLLLVSAVVAFLFPTPFVTPLLIVLGGLIASLNFRKLDRVPKEPLRIKWGNFVLWLAVLVVAAVLGGLTKSLPIRLFENFYRNGSLVFGGGQVLIPMLYTEFVEFKAYLTREEFLTGMALTQLVPGPVFSIATYVGSMSMKQFGVGGQLLGGFMATAGIFLPGTFLIFFVFRFWNQLKKYRAVRASLEGIHASSAGLTFAAAITLFEPVALQWQALVALLITVALLHFTKIPSYWIILMGLAAGFLIPATL